MKSERHLRNSLTAESIVMIIKQKIESKERYAGSGEKVSLNEAAL